jgi:protein involved in polysaccharide export with SLBB domain
MGGDMTNSRSWAVTVRVINILAMLSVILVLPLHGQSARGWDSTGLELSRTELQELLAEYEDMASSAAHSSTARKYARLEAGMLRQRLEEGDLRVGDRVMLVVERHLELTDTFSVVAGRKLVLPSLGEVSLEGVLRSELQPHLQQFISRFINSPVVHARSLVRMEIRGAVSRPGFYMLPSDMLLSDALMVAGGPTATAQVDRMRIERGRDVIWPADRLREAVIEGRTIDQLSGRAGDVVVVPERSSPLRSLNTVVAFVGAIGYLIVILTR